MKLGNSATVLVSALALLSCDKVPQTTRIQATNEVEMDLLMVRLAEPRAMKLIPHLRDRNRAKDATKEVIDLVAAGEATLIAWPFLATKSGQRAVFEQVNELRYATEYDPPSRSTVRETNGGAAGPPAAAAVTVDPLTQAHPITTKTTENLSEISPTAFATQNLGVTFEIEANIQTDGRTIDLNMVPQHVRLRGMRKVVTEGPREGDRTTVEQPEIVTHRITNNIAVQDGDYTLLSVFNVPD